MSRIGNQPVTLPAKVEVTLAPGAITGIVVNAGLGLNTINVLACFPEAPMPYNGGVSSGSNQGPLNPALAEAVRSRVDTLRAADPGNMQPVPVDLVTASGSGLDPEISIAAAEFQLPRIARERGLAEEHVRKLVQDATRGRALGVLGEPRVNVLELNLALDAAR